MVAAAVAEAEKVAGQGRSRQAAGWSGALVDPRPGELMATAKKAGRSLEIMSKSAKR